MLEKITTSPPFCCTASTKATYFFLVVGSLALDENLFIFVDGEYQIQSYLNKSSEISNVPIAPRSAAKDT